MSTIPPDDENTPDAEGAQSAPQPPVPDPQPVAEGQDVPVPPPAEGDEAPVDGTQPPDYTQQYADAQGSSQAQDAAGQDAAAQPADSSQQYAEPATEAYATPATEQYAAPTEQYAAPTEQYPSQPDYYAQPQDFALQQDYAQQPAYAQTPTPLYYAAPTPPKKRGNRGMGIVIALVATIVFAIVFAVVLAGILALNFPADSLLTALATYTLTVSFWGAVLVFFLAMVALVAIANRARWWVYILGGFFVGVLVYGAYLGGLLLDVEWGVLGETGMAQPTAVVLLGLTWVQVFAFVAGIVAREISVWAGAWISGRGRKMKERSAREYAEYEEQLAAGPQQGVPQQGVPPYAPSQGMPPQA